MSFRAIESSDLPCQSSEGAKLPGLSSTSLAELKAAQTAMRGTSICSSITGLPDHRLWGTEKSREASPTDIALTGGLGTAKGEPPRVSDSPPASGEARRERMLERPNHRVRQNDWTVIVNLNEHISSREKLDQLRRLAAQTAGTAVTFVVQVAVPNQGAGGSQHQLERYVIQNGEMLRLEDAGSNGAANDLTNLIRFALANYPGNRLALDLNMHGLGNEGVTGDTGNMSVSQLQQAIGNGLAGSGHQRFDLVDLDLCLMAQNGVLEQLSTVASHLVASRTTQLMPGQELGLSFSALLSNPAMDANALGDRIIQDNREGRVSQLSHFNLENYRELMEALDTFGDQLAGMLNDPASRRVIEGIIELTGRQTREPFHRVLLSPGTHDLQDFVNRIITAINNRMLPDRSGALRAAAEAVLAAQARVVASHYGDSGSGGLSTFLPNLAIRDVDFAVRQRTSAGFLAIATDLENNPALQESNQVFANRTQLIRSLIGDNSTTPRYLYDLEQEANANPELLESYRNIRIALTALAQAESAEQFRQALANLHTLAVNLEHSPFYAAQRQRMRGNVQQEINQARANHLIGHSGGWRRFRAALYRLH